MWPSAHNNGYPKRLVMGFVCIAIILSFVATLLLIDRFRSYEATLDMIVLSKSEQGAIEAPHARDALMLLGSQGDFLYTVNETADVSEIGLSATGATSFRIRAISDMPLDARDAAVAASQELFATIGKYYDLRSNIALRSIGSPKTAAIIDHPILLIASGVVSALIGSIIFFSFVLLIARIAFSISGKDIAESPAFVFPTSGEDPASHEESPPVFSREMFVPKKQDSTFFSFEPSSVAREKDYAHFNRGPAPANLPIAMDETESLPDFLFPIETDKADETAVPKEEGGTNGEVLVPESPVTKDPDDMPMESSSDDREPTTEEYKRRLNELLQGKIPS